MLQRLYHETVGKYTEVVSFIVLMSFLTTFVLARLTVYLIEAHILPDFYLFVGQTHVHHLNYGIFLLSITGYLSLIYNNEKMNELLAIFYGIGLGLTFDEFALWLHLQDDYYARVSYEAIIVITIILINVIYLENVWRSLFRLIGRVVTRSFGSPSN